MITALSCTTAVCFLTVSRQRHIEPEPFLTRTNSTSLGGMTAFTYPQTPIDFMNTIISNLVVILPVFIVLMPESDKRLVSSPQSSLLLTSSQPPSAILPIVPLHTPVGANVANGAGVGLLVWFPLYPCVKPTMKAKTQNVFILLPEIMLRQSLLVFLLYGLTTTDIPGTKNHLDEMQTMKMPGWR